MSLKVKYIDAPPGAQEDMAVTATKVNSMSLQDIVPWGGSDNPWATLESFGWPLDGTRELIPEEPAVGLWSNVVSDGSAGVLGVNRLGGFILGRSEPTARISQPPVITLQFTESFTATGITVTFAESVDEWCREMHISWYNGQTLLAEGTYFPDAARWMLVQVVEGFDQIKIELLKTSLGGHFAKIKRIELGQNVIFGREELASVSLINEVDPTLSELTVDTMTVNVVDKHDRVLYPQENQKMELRQNGVLIATQYIKESIRESRNGYSFTCQSAIGLLEDTFMGGMYNAEPLQNVVDAIMDGRPYVLGEFLNETISGYLPVCTRREALQQVAFAIGAIVTAQGDDTVRFSAIPEYVSGSFRKGEIFLGGSVETTPRIYKIEVDAHSYAPSEEVDVLVENEALDGAGVLLTFDEPHYDYAIDGGSIVESGVNWVRVMPEGPVTISAKKYIHSTVRHTKRNALATAAERSQIQTIDSATLIHSGNVGKLLDRLFEVARLRQTLTQEVVVGTQYAGQMVAIEGAWGESIQGYISAMEAELTQGGHTATVTVVGEWKRPELVHRYSGEVYSGDMEVLC